MSAVSRVMIEVGWGDCDPAEIVFYPNYFKWFDVGTHHLLAAAGLALGALRERYGIVGVPLLEAQASFVKPSRYGERIGVESQVVEVNPKTFRIGHEIFNRGELVVRGAELRAWVAYDADDDTRLRALPIPAEVRSRLLAERA